MRNTPLNILQKKIKSLSPNLQRLVHHALIHTSEKKRKIRRPKNKAKAHSSNTLVSEEDIPTQENMKNVFGYIADKFEFFHTKITDLKSAPGLCKSSYILNQKLEALRSSKEKICAEGQVSREFSSKVPKGFSIDNHGSYGLKLISD
ncbi:unnamed protein product [Moneuplotes crassus]|uniref:Uncharacterized protein n=1 Tax=Euplotes crassus TaxID=5936 RepID=A0AAD1U105_EUPCR|nr:unnamed protein product [Moneuplotes crassus]